MKTRFFPRRIFFAAFVLGFFALPLEAQGFFGRVSWFVNNSVFLFPEDNGLHSDPMPVLWSPGAGLSYAFTENFRAELAVDFYSTNYGYDYDFDRAVPYAIENRSARVIASLLAFQAAWYKELGSLLTLRLYGGPAADLRLVLIAWDLNSADMEDASRQTDSIRSYFWSRGRWFMPFAGAGLDFAVNERFKLGIDVRVWAPAYRLWTGEDLPKIEGWRFGPGIRLTIR